MADDVQKVILLPRFSSFAGSQVFRTLPMNVRAFSGANITAWCGAMFGSAMSISITVEESPDLLIWESLGVSLTPAAGGEDTDKYEFTKQWIRLGVSVGGGGPVNGPGATCWAVGEFIIREA